VVESLGIDPSVAEALGIGDAAKGMMNGYVAFSVRLPTGGLNSYIGIAEGNPEGISPFPSGYIPKKSA